MAQRRVHPAAIAAASDGSILINVADALPARVRERLEQVVGSGVFVGVALSERDAHAVVARLDGAAAEASAQLLGGGHPKLLAAQPTKRGKSAAARPRSRR
ncbi:MAG TPA: hypothetical protein VEX18_23060 [Polyangiaceae bacterium]|nr:hypothetical protein [Polyangiaceae bacterium]